MTSRTVSPALAFAVAALGIGLFSMMDAVMKSLVLAIGVYNALLWRQMVSVGLGAVAWRLGKSGRPSARALKLHCARGLVTTAMAVLFFWGLARVPMAQAISLTYIAPILALLLAAVTLGERVGWKTVVASIVALGGVVVVMIGQGREVPGPETLLGTLSILGSAVLYAVNLVIARLQSQAARPGEIAFFQALVIAATLALAASWLAVVPEAASWPKLVLAAGLATASLWLLGWAYAHGDTGFLATTEYTSFVYAAGLGFLVFGERVSAFTLAGAAVIVVACLYAARRRDIAQTSIEATV
ncbi:MAG: DMT family transporter [Sphingomonas sp.]|jgi:S-adenosylmethionine uptake transporter|uniref:S-adenosylmethionine uptake transporter n=1 Tax=Sphingomonas aurantiaca TaxID=185949 RepID=A0A2T5GSE1_9SPHN|nr:DMT family transporter [Sphingomonas aurantiaca]PTQ62226.1 S-adenosylmethionine uptake transporter [Sphingomonas aurantiaca]RZM17903.1 MAG: DMT family transporter [Sphingomonas sp.]